MKFFLTLFLSISFLIASSQDTIIKESKNTMTGIYSQSGTSQKISLSLLSDNSIKSNLFDISTGTTFAYVYGTTVLGNDIQQKTYIRYDNEFLLHVFNYSYIRGINSENSYGIGYGKWWKLVSVTYALLYQTTQYSDFTRSDIYRHSFRLKFHFEIKKINLSFE